MLGVLDLPVHLCERFFARHGEDRVTEGDEEADQAENHARLGIEGIARLLLSGLCRDGLCLRHLAGLDPEGLGNDLRHPADRVTVEGQVRRGGRRRKSLLVGLTQDGRRAPQDHDDHHHRRHIHDPQRIVGRLVDAPGVPPPEIGRDEDGDPGGQQVHDLLVWTPGVAEIGRGLRGKPDDVLSSGDARNRPGEDVVEHQSRHRELCERAAHRFLHDAVDATSGEHRAGFHVNRTDGVREEHHSKDEPRRRRADGLLGNSPDVIRRRPQIVQDASRRSPERDEAEHDGCGDDDLRADGRLRFTWSGHVTRLRFLSSSARF